MEMKLQIKEPLVSVIIPCFNSELWIASCLKSVYNQSHKNIEVIIVDDGSTDETAEIIQKVKKQNTYYLYKPNGGVSSARNFGIKKANGELIAFLDSDDFWHKDKIETQVNAIQKGFDLIYSDYELLEVDNHTILPHTSIDPINFKAPIKEMLLSKNIVAGGSSVMLKKNILEKIGYFREDIVIGEDWELWTRILWYNFKPYFVSKKLCFITKSKTSAQHTTNDEIWRKSTEKVLESFFHLPKINEREKAIIYRGLFKNNYRFNAQISEFLKYRFKSCCYNPMLIFSLSDNLLTTKLFIKKILNK